MTARTLETLRAEFDATFALPLPQLPNDPRSFLTIRLGDRPYALSLAELGWIATGHRITPIPSLDHGLLGLSSVRGRTVPVFDLAVMLGEPAQLEVRWVVLSAGLTPIGLAFTALEGHLRLEASELGTVLHGGRQLTGQVIRTIPEHRPIINVSMIAEQLLAVKSGNRERNNG